MNKKAFNILIKFAQKLNLDNPPPSEYIENVIKILPNKLNQQLDIMVELQSKQYLNDKAMDRLSGLFLDIISVAISMQKEDKKNIEAIQMACVSENGSIV